MNYALCIKNCYCLTPPFRWMFGAGVGTGFGGFPNPPPLSISISRCNNYCCFPYHLKRITNSYTHSSVDCKSTEHPPQRVFGAGFGGFPNPPPLSISISRCDNYCCFPYHLKRITNSYTHSSVDCKSTEHPQQRMFGAGFGGFAIRRIRQAQQQDSHILILRWIANPPNIRRNG